MELIMVELTSKILLRKEIDEKIIEKLPNHFYVNKC